MRALPLFAAAVSLLALGSAVSPVSASVQPSERNHAHTPRRLPKSHELTDAYTYEEFLVARGIERQRARESDELKAERAAAFQRNLQLVLDHNQGGDHSYSLAVNKFFDWTEEELRAAGALPSRGMQKLHAVAEQAFGAPSGEATGASGSVTREAFDWRYVSPPVLTTAKDQGLCGSCWAHATTEAVESRHAIKHGVLNELSQQQLVSCAPNLTYTAHMNGQSVNGDFNSCNGYFPNYALNWLTSDAAFGPGNFVELWQNPYRSFFAPEAGSPNIFNITGGPPDPHVPTCDSWMPELPPFAVVNGYKFVSSNDVSAFEEALINHGPVVSVISLQCMELAFYEGGIFSCPACVGGTYSPSHVINIVGFGEDRATGQSYWVVRNSWGGDWGENGYVRFARNTTTESCGHMILPDDLNNINGTWGYQTACGMCGVLAYGLVPDVV